LLPCNLPIVQAPMAGGPSTPELAAAVAAAGGFPYVAAAYLSPDALDDAIVRTRELTPAPLGVNLFVPSPNAADPDAIADYARQLEPEAQRLGVALGDPHWDDDAFDEKLDRVIAARVHTVSFTFGCPDPQIIDRLHRAGAHLAVTVTNATDATHAADAGADSLVVQGTEAGGHQGTFDSATANHTTLLDAIAAVRDATELPLIAAGGIMTADDAAAAINTGAAAVQLGTALLLAAEAGTSAVHRDAIATNRYPDTIITRAFSGRWARGLANRFATEHQDAPGGYPQIYHLTRPLRAAATKAGDADVPNLWAGTGWRQAVAESTAAIVQRIAAGTTAGHGR
jgi:nitronate monooxygenase